MTMKRRAGGVWLGLVATFCGTILAAIPVARAGIDGPRNEPQAIRVLYADAIHAYFSGDYQRAYDSLSQVVEAGSRDPRVWYFRGLAALNMGRIDEAEADFEMAAAREAAAWGEWPVARSLERVQGQQRLALERHRVQARVARLAEIKAAEDRRRSVFDGLQPEVTRPILPEGERRTLPEGLDAEELPAGEAVPAEPLPVDDLDG